MLDAGEDPLYVTRRLVRMALEDIGLADPWPWFKPSPPCILSVPGSPEGDLALAQTVVYLALAPKSNAIYAAFGKALDLARKTGAAPVPMHIRNAPTPLLKELGYGRDYHYPHDAPDAWVPENYLPEVVKTAVFYEPTLRGWEGEQREVLQQRRQEQAKTENRKLLTLRC